jgi:hypothetical protein
MSILWKTILVAVLTIAFGSSAYAEIQFAPLDSDLVTPNRVVGKPGQEILVYRRPGANPCKVAAGCTIEWAVGEAVKAGKIPAEIAPKLIEEVKHGKYLPHEVKYGDIFWMTEGSTPEKLRFSAMARASWSDKNKTYPAMHWFVMDGTVSYHIMKIDICSNWAGWTAGPIRLLIDKGNEMWLPVGNAPVVSCEGDTP